MYFNCTLCLKLSMVITVLLTTVIAVITYIALVSNVHQLHVIELVSNSSGIIMTSCLPVVDL